MAINTYRFWMATDSNRLLANQTSFIQANAPAFYQGNVANLELHIVASAGVGVTPIEIPFPAGAEISVAVGNTNSYPTGGSWELSVDDIETGPMPYNATTAQVAAALNALASVSAAGGVSVSKTGEGYSITWNTYGSKPTIGIGSDTLTPSSYESISLVQAGSAEHRQIVFVELRQNPIALSNVWTPLPQPSITSTLVKAWDGSSVIWRVTIYPQPKAGTMTLSYGTKTATIDVASSPTTIALALEAQVFATGQYQWDIALAEDTDLIASGNLIGYNGYSGTINFATAECHQFLAGDESKNTTLEVSMSVDGKRYTLIQTGCQILADVISDGVLVPLPLGVALSEQVANVRFVRRDVDQAPTPSTQDVIWGNLGVMTLGSNVVGAIDASDSPSANNPFATISDIPTVTQAEWGNITGDINSQTDLATILNGLDVQKYDVTNPAGYIDGSYLNGYATESWVQSQGYLTNATLNGYAQLSGSEFTGPVTFSGSGSINVGGYDSDGYPFLRFGSGINPLFVGWGNFYFDGSDFKYGDGQNQAQTIASRLWVNNQGYLTSSALTPYAPKASPVFSGDITLSNPILNSGKLSVVATSTLNYTSDLTHSMLRIGYVDPQSPYSYLSRGNLFLGSGGTGYFQVNVSETAGFEPNVILSNIMSGLVTKITDGKFLVNDNQGGADYEPYARTAGTTFTGVVNLDGALYHNINGGFLFIKSLDGLGAFTQYGNNGITVFDPLGTSGSAQVVNNLVNIATPGGVSTQIRGNTATFGGGASFAGKVNFTSVGGQAGLNVGIGGTSTSATSNGDLWISTGGTNLNFRDATGSWRILVNTSNTNTFSASQIIDTTSTTAALRVTQKGTGNAIEVEDSTTPDATRFVVDQFGKVGVGTAPDATAAIKIDGNGISFNGLTFNPTATAAHTGGTDTLDLLVTINGVNYRLGLRPA